MFAASLTAFFGFFDRCSAISSLSISRSNISASTIVVTDKAGNTAEMTVTVNDGHTYGEWVSNGDGTHTRQCTVDGCNGL